MTVEEEQRFALLASVLDLGGRGRKQEVLDNIEAKGYLKFDERDLRTMANRDELYWRNNIAFVRKHLVGSHHLDGGRFNNWEITASGQSYFQSLSSTVIAERFFRKLTPAAVQRASH